jgi:Ca2+-binding EF-hand superfamily protein
LKYLIKPLAILLLEISLAKRDGFQLLQRLMNTPDDTGRRGDDMKNRTLAILALTLMAGSAHATEPYFPKKERGFMKLDLNKDGKIERGEFDTVATKRFSRFDANSDASVTTAEVEQLLQKGFEKRKARYLAIMDRNRDGTITKAEFDSVVDAMFAEADSDRDGGLTLAEMQGFKRGAWARRMIDAAAAGGAN